MHELPITLGSDLGKDAASHYTQNIHLLSLQRVARHKGENLKWLRQQATLVAIVLLINFRVPNLTASGEIATRINNKSIFFHLPVRRIKPSRNYHSTRAKRGSSFNTAGRVFIQTKQTLLHHNPQT